MVVVVLVVEMKLLASELSVRMARMCCNGSRAMCVGVLFVIW